MDILCNYQGYKKCVLILVFDAYKVEGYALEIQKYHNIHVVYTKEAETADQYIEKVVHHIGRKYHVTVVTSDGVEQVITMGQGGTRISSRDFLEEIEYTKKLIEEDNEKQRVSDRNYLFDHADGYYHLMGCMLSAASCNGWWMRSEERRVGKECRSRWSPYH